LSAETFIIVFGLTIHTLLGPSVSCGLDISLLGFTGNKLLFTSLNGVANDTRLCCKE